MTRQSQTGIWLEPSASGLAHETEEGRSPLPAADGPDRWIHRLGHGSNTSFGRPAFHRSTFPLGMRRKSSELPPSSTACLPTNELPLLPPPNSPPAREPDVSILGGMSGDFKSPR